MVYQQQQVKHIKMLVRVCSLKNHMSEMSLLPSQEIRSFIDHIGHYKPMICCFNSVWIFKIYILKFLQYLLLVHSSFPLILS